MTSEQRILHDRYRLVYKLGAGGMGSVWLAEDRRLERTVALKELIQHADGTDLDERRTRALREARAMARVRHPTIVSIHDIFFDDGDPWIVMEYINGRSLDSIIKGANRDERPLTEQAIARMGLPVLHGLCAAHRASVVHRDVKPANILVADDESIFLVDFGIAKITGDASLTGMRKVLGTTEFLAPERLQGAEAGPAADLWSLGVTLFYALEGYSPFLRGGEWTLDATMWAILRDNPPRPVRQGPLANVILRLLDKNPERRADGDDLADVLQSIAAGKPPRPEWAAQPTQPVAEPPAVKPPTRHSTAMPSAAKPPGRPPSQPIEVRRAGLGFEDAREMIQSVNTDTGVAMLLAMPDDQAALILADYPSRVCGELLQGIAAARLGTAATILRILRTADAGRVVGYLKPDSAAFILATMPVEEAVRILSHAGVRTAAGIITEMPIKVSAPLAKAMQVERAVEVLAYVKPATVAALLVAASDGSYGGLLRQFKPTFRSQIMRFL